MEANFQASEEHLFSFSHKPPSRIVNNSQYPHLATFTRGP